MTIGTSKGVTIPKGWLDFFEKESGKKIKEVLSLKIDKSQGPK